MSPFIAESEQICKSFDSFGIKEMELLLLPCLLSGREHFDTPQCLFEEEERPDNNNNNNMKCCFLFFPCRDKAAEIAWRLNSMARQIYWAKCNGRRCCLERGFGKTSIETASEIRTRLDASLAHLSKKTYRRFK